MAVPSTLIFILLALVAIPLVIVGVIYLIVPGVKGLIWLIRHLARFIFSMIGDGLRAVGSVLAALLFMLLTVANLVIGRWSASGHYGRAVQGEFTTMGRCLYRLAVSHPLRLLCLSPLTEGIEQRLPEVIAGAPGADRPGRRTGTFEGYAIVGSLPVGGSGARLYIAEPDQRKREVFSRAGAHGVDRVVIKSFSLSDGSTLPQIVRESRALPAARKLGLILEHELTDERFFYVTRYVPGESLGLITQRLHASAGPDGLGPRELRGVLSYAGDLLTTLSNYHAGGLWHKDVKPDNVIISDGRAHLVDFGLVTPLRSSMTLTTHGTEYFRDPELVRMALRGVKVHEVDGAKFDVYALGAVLYSMIENSFPAHGGLSQITRRCPESVRWIVRRAMTDYDKRYSSAAAMLEDLRFVAAADDPFAVKPADLPSVRGGGSTAWGVIGGDPGVEGGVVTPTSHAHPTPGAPRTPGGGPYAWGSSDDPERPVAPARSSIGGRRSASVRVTDWWTGRYAFEQPNATAAAFAASAAGARNDDRHATPRPPAIPNWEVRPAVSVPPASRTPSSAAEQVLRARERASAARRRAQERMRSHSAARGNPRDFNAGVVVATLVVIALFSVPLVYLYSGSSVSDQQAPSGMTVRVESSEASAPFPAITGVRAQHPSTDTATLLVLKDFGVASQPDERELITALFQEFTRRGHQLIGDAAAADSERSAAADSTAEAERAASLRAAVGLESFRTAAALSAVHDWFEHDDADADAVLWIARGESGTPDAWLIARPGADQQLIESIVEALNSSGCAVERSDGAPVGVTSRG